MGVSGQHGFEESVPLSPSGTNTICAYAIGLAGDNNALIECRNSDVQRRAGASQDNAWRRHQLQRRPGNRSRPRR